MVRHSHTHTSQENEQMEEIKLVGYIRRSPARQQLKLSINVQAFEQCHKYRTADGQSYVPLIIGLNTLRKILDGVQAVTTIIQEAE